MAEIGGGKLDLLRPHPKEKRVVLANCGRVDPESLGDYAARGGYEAAKKALLTMTPADVVRTIADSGLRGRGGGGFPTGKKWAFVAAEPGPEKFVICNADEGDPGAFMDRSVLELDPHAVVEGMLIAGYASGASRGFVYVRAEYPLAAERIAKAIADARAGGYLGADVFGSGFSFEASVRLGAGAFVCGEETALIASIEGERGMPRNKPPFPAQRGLWGKPTLINNVETFANVAPIVRNGAPWFRGIGTPASPGTKVFALAGKSRMTGLIEVPMGITLGEIVMEIGGGVGEGRTFKAVLTGGPSGGCLTREHLDVPVDFDNLLATGSMMGSGGMIVLDDTDCMVDIARFYMEFMVDESCGKCPPCREGTFRMSAILEAITGGRGTRADLDDLGELAAITKDVSLCGLGQTAPNPVLSTLRHFREEYEAHVTGGRCPAGSCAAFARYSVTEACVGCGKCIKICPAGCVSGSPKARHRIDGASCLKCGACADACPVGAIARG